MATQRYVPQRWLSEGAECLVDQLKADPGFTADVVVVGSGYGAAVAAARFSAMKRASDGQQLKVLVLERGNEYVPGAFADRFEQALPHIRADRWSDEDLPDVADTKTGLDQALYDFKIGPEVSALVANGLGGGSLINANVVERPQDEVFQQDVWPSEIKNDFLHAHPAFYRYFDAAEGMLGAAPFAQPPAKTQALFDDTAELESHVHHVGKVMPKIAVAQRTGTNPQGVEQVACVQCGNCVTGCNYWAKNTLPMNYLALARRQGARLYTGATVLGVRPDPQVPDCSVWIVSFRLTNDRRELDVADGRFELMARHVVLAAGTYGTPQILHQSLSAPGGAALKHLDPTIPGSQLGEGFSCNGDGIAAVYDQASRPHPVGGVGADPSFNLANPANIGPTVTGMLDLRRRSGGVEKSFVIQDAAIPFALKRLYEEVLTSLHTVYSMVDWNERKATDTADPLAVDQKRIERTQFLLIVGHDDAKWKLRFKATKSQAGAAAFSEFLSLVYVDERKKAAGDNGFAAVRERQRYVGETLAHLSRGAFGGTYLPNPVWQPAPQALITALRPTQSGADEEADPLGSERLFTVHPLGGCRMAEEGSSGVVNHLGQVFKTKYFHATVFDNLVVMDGSIMPGSLGINPLLTIAALAERASEKLAVKWGYVASGLPLDALPTRPPQVAPMAWAPKPTSLRFTEVATGGLQLVVNKDADFNLLDKWQTKQALDAYGRLKVEFTVRDLQALCSNAGHMVPNASADLKLIWKGMPAAAGEQLQIKQGNPPVQPFPISLMTLLPSERIERTWRALLHWYDTRGKAALHDQIPTEFIRRLADKQIHERLLETDPQRRAQTLRDLESGLLATLCSSATNEALTLAKIASHHGEARVLDYNLGTLAPGQTPFTADVRVLAAKRIHYGYSPGYRQRPSKGVHDPLLPDKVPSNPWRSMVELQVLMVSETEGRPLEPDDWPQDQRPDWIEQGAWKVVAVGTWTLNLGELITRNIPQLTGYQTLPDAWMDMVSFGAFTARCLGQTNFWRWKLPAYPKPLPRIDNQKLGPLPGHIMNAQETKYVDVPGRGHTWERYPLTVGSGKTSAEIMLTNFRPAAGAPARKYPVVMMHAFVSSGYHFATPRIKVNAVQWLTSRGFDVWVLELRTSVALKSSHQAWDFDVVALEDVRPAFKKVLEKTGASQAHAVVHCMGSAVFNMAVLQGQLTENGLSMVRSAVQTQVSMDVVSTPPNSLKASAIRFLEDLFDAKELTVVADESALKAVRIMETLVDRLLLTWPTNDYDATLQADNDLYERRQEFVATVNRINAMYGRNFSHDNISDDMRAHLHEVFRHAHARTIRHVIQFARAGRVVDYDGNDAYVSDKNIKDHYQFPVRFLHGQFGAVFGQASTRRSRIRLDRLHPGVVHDRIVLRAPRCTCGIPVHRNWGHFDIWVSDLAAQEVFPCISDFLETQDAAPVIGAPAARPAMAPAPDPYSYRLPELGPLVGWWRAASGAAKPNALARLWFRSPFRDDKNTEVAVYAIDLSGIKPKAKELHAYQQVLLALGCGAIDVVVPTSVAGWPILVICRSLQKTWFADPDPSRRPDNNWLWSWNPATLELIPDAVAESTLSRPNVMGMAASQLYWTRIDTRLRDKLACLFPGPIPDPVLPYIASAAAHVGPAPIRIESAVFDQLLPGNELTFMLASCRYQATDMEADIADVTLVRPKGAKIAFALMVGDQIYADASYGVFDGRPSLDRLRSKYTALWSGRAGALGRGVPLYLCGDDHEVRDNWFHGLRASQDQRDSDSLGRTAMDAYQYLATPAGNPNTGQVDHRDYEFKSGGFDFYVLNTRFERTPPGARIWSTAQRDRFVDWLRQRPNTDRPVFVVNAVPIFPFKKDLGTREDLGRGDCWQSYPESMGEFFDALFDPVFAAKCSHVVLLSGDLHLSYRATGLARLANGSGRELRIDSIVSSGLNAPIPFANQQRGDYMPRFSGLVPAAGSVNLDYQVESEEDNDSWAEVRVAKAGGVWQVTATFK